MTFNFDLGQEVAIILTDKVGQVKGRAEYLNGAPNSYWVQYVDGQGDLTSNWIDEQDLRFS